MANGWSPEELAIAWQSAPAHLRGGASDEAVHGHRSDTPSQVVPAAEPGAAAAGPDGMTEFPTAPQPTIRPKPIWHAVSPSRSGSQPTEELRALGHRIRGMAADLAASTCEWLHLIEQFDRAGGWAGVGVASCAAWLSWTCSVSPATAREYVRIARSLPLLPQIDAAFAAGKLSYSKVRVLVTVAAEVDESVLLKQAEIQTVSQLERTVRAFRRGGGWQQEKERRASWRWDDDGMLVVSARLPPDEGALLIAALEQSRKDTERTAEGGGDWSDDAVPGTASPVSDEDRRRAALTRSDPCDVARADMLVTLAERALAAGTVDSSGDDRHLVVVHADLDQLAERQGQLPDSPPGPLSDPLSNPLPDPPPDRLPGPRCHIENGPGLPRQVARRIACDAALVAVVHHVGAGEPLRLGRKTRPVSPAQRRALRIRDGGCRFPGCPRRTHLNAHHVRPWSLFGPTDLDNLVLLCRFHHMLVHEGGFTVAVRDRGSRVTFRDPRGEPVSVPALPGSRGVRPTLVRAIDPAGLLPGWRGEPFHLAETAGVLAGSAAAISRGGA